MRINTNMAALNAWRSMTVNTSSMTKSLEKLSSGYRVNRAADDAAGLAVSEKMRAQIRGLNMAIRNAQDGVSLVQTAEGGAQKIQDMLQRMRELAVQASSGTLQKSDKELLQKEFAQLKAEITRTAETSKFNDIKLASVIDGVTKGTTYTPPAGQTFAEYATSTISIQVGPGATTQDKIDVTIADLRAEVLAAEVITGSQDDGAGNVTETEEFKSIVDLDISTEGKVEVVDVDTGATKTTLSGAEIAIKVIDEALTLLSETRATFGAVQNRLEAAIETLQIQAENLTAAESRIRDVDMAQEMATFTKYQILQQASTAMLAQANQSTQAILSLLR